MTRTAWNKGLTKYDDERIMRQSEAIKGNTYGALVKDRKMPYKKGDKVWWQQRGLPNPMKNPKTKAKMIKTIKEAYATGKYIGYWKGKKNPNTSLRNKLNPLPGEKNPQWKGGVTNERRRLEKTFKYKFWRDSVLERDNFLCQKCNSDENLEAHHIKRWALYPELRFEINNGTTLCKSCHSKETAKEMRL